MIDNKDGIIPAHPQEITNIAIEDEMKRSYLDYAMSVIVSRALPDVRDGLKPVHRRILYSMHENGFEWNKPYRKSARVVGDVIGKYHPHGDIAIYDALVRMAQDFSLRLPLLDGQGNFGSVDDDPAAAMRYTEVRMGKSAHGLLDDIDRDTVDFRPNYDNSETEPLVLPARFPNLLVNGSGGIAVGMATNMAPHNLGEVVDGLFALIENPELNIDDLQAIILGPDFPTGGIILGRTGIKSAFHTGRGAVTVRGKVEVEELRKDREALIISEIPYQVSKAGLVAKIADLVRDKRIEGISDIRDESDRRGMRVVVELKRDAVGDVVLNQLYRYSPLQTSFNINNVALSGGRPELLNLKDLLQAFLSFREEVITRRHKFLLRRARDRAHILVGLAIAVANIDEVIALIRRSKDAREARDGLMMRQWPARTMADLITLIADPRHCLQEDGTYRLSEEQARAILELRLQRLTALGRDEIAQELEALAKEIADYLAILRSRERIMTIIRDELAAVKQEFATPRRTQIQEYDSEVEDEDLIQREDMVVTVSHAGYVKRVPLSTYRSQRRGGKGRAGMQTRDEDFVVKLFVANTHTPILFFSSHGMAYRIKVWRLPIGNPQSRGKALINLLPLSKDERITTILPLPEDGKEAETRHLMFATRSGTVRRNALSDFENINRAGKIAMKLDPGDMIAGVEICSANNDVLLTSAQGQSIRFAVDEVRLFKGRDSTGVRGIRLEENDHLISMTILNHSEVSAEERAAFLKMSRAQRSETEEECASPTDEKDGEEKAEELTLKPERFAQLSAQEQVVLTISANGYGKRSSSYHYRVTGRGGKGIVAMVVNDRNGPLVASFPVADTDHIMAVTDGGQLIRCPVHDIRLAGRSTQGVIVINTAQNEQVVSVEHLQEDTDAEDV